jgi:hypothetical protein
MARQGTMAMIEVTIFFEVVQAGDPLAAAQLVPLIYDDLRRLAARRLTREAPWQTLQATVLVNVELSCIVIVRTAPFQRKGS